MKPAVIAKMCGTKIKYPTAKGDDVMTQVTDKMVKAFRREAESNKWDILNENGVQIGFNRDEATRAGIEAALSVAEPPSPMVAFALNVELKSLQDELDAALSTQFDPDYARALLAQERALQSTIRQQISPAVADASLRSNAEPPSPGDAEFEAALNCHEMLVLKTRFIAQKDVLLHLNALESSRQHILDLHRQARMAGLRELRAEIEKAMRESTAFDAPDFGYMIAMGEIDAMLKEATE